MPPVDVPGVGRRAGPRNLPTRGWLAGAALAGLCLAVPWPARAEVTRVGEPSVATGTLLAPTWSHTVPAGGVGRYLIVAVSVDQEAGRPAQVTSLTAGGVPLERVGMHSRMGAAHVELWALPAPPEGRLTLSLRLSQPTGFVAGAISFVGVAPGALYLGGQDGQGAVAGPLPPDLRPGAVTVAVYASSGTTIPMGAPGQEALWAQRARVVGAAALAHGVPGVELGFTTPGVDQAWALAAVALLPSGSFDGGAPVDAAPSADADAGGGGDGRAAGGDGAPAGDGGVPPRDAAAPDGGGPRADAASAREAGASLGDGRPFAGEAAGDAGGAPAPADGDPPGEDPTAGDAGAAPSTVAVDLDVGCGCRVGGRRAAGGPTGALAALAGLALLLGRRRGRRVGP
jgi:MYXO-CTERM domain-containing protein